MKCPSCGKHSMQVLFSELSHGAVDPKEGRIMECLDCFCQVYEPARQVEAHSLHIDHVECLCPSNCPYDDIGKG